MNNIAAETKPQYIVWHKNGLRIPKSDRWGNILKDEECFIRPNIEGNIYRIHVIIRHSWNEFLMGNAAGLLNIFLRNPYTIESLEIIRDQIIKNMRDRDGGSHWDTYDDRHIDDINRIIEFKRMTILDHKLLGLWPGMD